MANEAENHLTSTPTVAKKKKRWWIIVLDIVLLIIFLLALAVSANVIYLTSAYGEPFYVNGASMYPTLNKNGYRLVDGEYIPLTWNDSHNDEGDIVDYGWAKSGSTGNWRTTLSRYDIVITYFYSDYLDPDNLVLNSSASLKIKRVIGLPGETVKLEYDESNTAWGKTTITYPDGSTEILPNLYDESDFPDLPNGYKYEGLDVNRTGKWKLGDDEYFLVGDNRAASHSEDSRSKKVGPVKADFIQGKAYLLTGQRELVREEGKLTPKFSLSHLSFPWDYVKLDDWL